MSLFIMTMCYCFFYGKFHLLKSLFINIGKDECVTDFFAGLHGLCNVGKLIFGYNIFEPRNV